MINNIIQIRLIETQQESALAGFTVAGGASGWVDTDISAVVPGDHPVSFWSAMSAATQAVGVREAGSAVNRTGVGVAGSRQPQPVCRVIGGHVEFRRDAADNQYWCMGYID